MIRRVYLQIANKTHDLGPRIPRALCAPRSERTSDQAGLSEVGEEVAPRPVSRGNNGTLRGHGDEPHHNAAGHAPLRYARVSPNSTNRPSVPYVERQTEPGTSSERPLARLDRVEFWARFVCGAILGLFIALDAGISTLAMDISLKLWLAALVIITVGSGLLAAKLRDKFWYSLMERWFA
jgi:hypothetical protein